LLLALGGRMRIRSAGGQDRVAALAFAEEEILAEE